MEKVTLYTVRQLARMAGVSDRTLRFYDEIGLLRPMRNPQNGYRVYDRAALLRLQQILFLRELGLRLDEIRAAVDRPGFDLLRSLEAHRTALYERKERVERLIGTVERTIEHLRGDKEMDEQQLFEGFSEEQQKEYEKEVERRYGDRYLKVSQQRWASYSPEKKKEILAEGSRVYQDLVAAIPQGAGSAAAQAGVVRWHAHLRYFYDPEPEVLLGLAEGYNSDPAFRATFDSIHPELAPFMRTAVQIYVEQMEQSGVD